MLLSAPSLFPDPLDVNLNADLVADDQASRIQRLVPGDAEIPPVDLGRTRGAPPEVAPGVLDLGRGSLQIDGDLAGDAVQGKVADDLEFSRIAFYDLLGYEGDGR